MVSISGEWIFLTWRSNLYLKNILCDLEHLIWVRLVVKMQLMVMLSLQWKKKNKKSLTQFGRGRIISGRGSNSFFFLSEKYLCLIFPLLPQRSLLLASL